MWRGSLLCWKTEWDKSPHTSPDFLFSLYMTGRVQTDSTMQHYCRFPHTTPLPPDFLFSSWIVFTDFVLQQHITAPSAGQGCHVLCKHRMKPWHQVHGALKTVIPAEMYILVFLYIDILISPVCLPFRETLKLHFPSQISKCIVRTLTLNISKYGVLTISMQKFLDLSVSELRRSYYPKSDVKLPGF